MRPRRICVRLPLVQDTDNGLMGRRRKKKGVENVEEKKMEGKGNKERRRGKKYGLGCVEAQRISY